MFCGCCALQTVVLRGVQAWASIAQVELETSVTFPQKSLLCNTGPPFRKNYAFVVPGINFSVVTGKSCNALRESTSGELFVPEIYTTQSPLSSISSEALAGTTGIFPGMNFPEIAGIWPSLRIS